MVTHYQLGVGPTRAICQAQEDEPSGGHRCLAIECDHCEHVVVTCGTCLNMAATILERLTNDLKVPCQCGKAYQSRAGWEAQGSFEDTLDGYGIHHTLAPDKCVELKL